MRTIVPLLLVVSVCAAHCNAAVVEYTNRNAWLSAAGDHTRIDFTGFPKFTLITDQYASLGVQFTDGIDLINHSLNSFPNDQWGLHGAFDEIAVAFNQPMYSIGVDHPGSMKFRLYWQGSLVYTSSDFVHGGTGFFSGLVSDQPFDAAVILDPSGNVFIDDLYFGPPIPAAPGIALLTLASFAGRGQRRRA